MHTARLRTRIIIEEIITSYHELQVARLNQIALNRYGIVGNIFEVLPTEGIRKSFYPTEIFQFFLLCIDSVRLHLQNIRRQVSFN